MQRILTARFLKRSLQVLLSLALASWILSAGPLAAASPGAPQRAASKCPTIPANFDVAHASTAELHRYLLPARPPAGDPQAVSEWQHTVEVMIHGGGVCVPDLKIAPTLNQGRNNSTAPLLVNCLMNVPPGTICNTAWTGYYAGNDTSPGYNEVVGQWNVQCVTGSKSPADSRQVSWIGLGGVWDGTLWQAGSGWKPSVGYYLWYEALGGLSGDQNEQIFKTGIQCGKHVSVDLWFAPNDPSSDVAFNLVYNGTSYRYSAPAGFSSGFLSAEWIDERGESCGFLTPRQAKLWALADYNYSAWTHAYASPNTPTAGFYSIGQLTHTRVWMVDQASPNRIAWADALGSETGSGTDNFRTNWEANGASDCG